MSLHSSTENSGRRLFCVNRRLWLPEGLGYHPRPMRLLLLIGLCALRRGGVGGTAIEWLADDVTAAVSTRGTSSFELLTSSMRQVLASGASGHFRLQMFDEVSDCIEFSATESDVESALRSLNAVRQLGTVSVRRSDYGFAYSFDASSGTATVERTEYGFSYTVTLNGTASAVSQAVDSVAVDGTWCVAPVTTGLWEEETNWSPSVVPGEGDDVTIGSDSGRIVLGEDHAVDTLEMSGGVLVTSQSTCPDGWFARPTRRPRVAPLYDTPFLAPATECFRAYATSLSWSDAEAACHADDTTGYGHLVTVESFEENEYVKHLCLGVSSTSPCWIGLTDASAGAAGVWRWPDERRLANSAYAAWGRNQPDNFTHLSGGEHCAQMMPAASDPEMQAQGRWNDADCDDALPFVCQSFGMTYQHVLTVRGAFNWYNGHIGGTGLVELRGATTVSLDAAIDDADDGVEAFRAVGLMDGVELRSTGTMNVAEATSLQGEGGSRLINDGALTLGAGAAGIVRLAATGAPCTLTNNGSVTVEGNVSTSWHVQNYGVVELAEGAVLSVERGGALANGRFVVPADAELVFNGDSVAMTQPEVYALQVSADSAIVGEYTDWERTTWRDTPTELEGTFRLRVRDPFDASASATVTPCIPYASSAAELQDMLNALAPIVSLGGVTVSRAGDGEEPWAYGYRWIIVFEY